MINTPKFPKKQISEYTSDEELAMIMTHAKKLGVMDYWWQCFRRRCQLKRSDETSGSTELEKAFHEIMYAYEILKSEAAGRTIHATFTWRKVDRDNDVKPILEKWALSKNKEDGFKFLIDNGQYDLTGEYLVLQYPNQFSLQVLASARKSLIDAGVPDDKLPLLH